MRFLYPSLFVLVVLPLICFGLESDGNCFPDLHKDWLQIPKDYHGNNLTDARAKRDVSSKAGLPRYFAPFDESLEKGINRQINVELYAHYTYLSMAYHFKRNDIYMEGFHNFFMKMAKEEHEHAQMFMDYQLKRGGTIRLHDIQKPCEDGIWGSGTMAMRKALELEHNVTNVLHKLHELGENDAQFQDFLESNFLAEQVESVKQLTDYVNTLNRLDGAIGEYHFDKMTLGGK